MLMKLSIELARVAQELHATLAKAAILLFNTNIRQDNVPRPYQEQSCLQDLQRPTPQSFVPQPPSTSARSQISVHPRTSPRTHTKILDTRCQLHAFLDIKYLRFHIITCGSDEVAMNHQANKMRSQRPVAVCWELVVGLGGRSWVCSIGVTKVVRAQLECQLNRRLGTEILFTWLFGPATTSRFSSMLRMWLRAARYLILGSSLDASLLRSHSLTAPVLDPSRTIVGLSQSTAVTSWALSTGTRLLASQPPSSRSCKKIRPLDPATAKMQTPSSGLAANAR